MPLDTFQLGEPVEHRGIVVTPLFPRRDPVAAYLTLDEALPRGFHIDETSDAGSVPELVVVNPLDARRAALRRRGARRREAEPDPQRHRARRGRREAADPRLVRRAGSLARTLAAFDAGDAHLALAPAAAQGAGARRAAARARRRAGRGVGRGAREAARACASTRRPRPAGTRSRRTGPRSASLEGAFPLAPGQCGAVLALGDDLCLDAVSRPDAFALLWPKLRAGYLLDALERLDGSATSVERIAAFVDAVSAARVDARAVGRARRGRRLRGTGVIGSGLELDGETIQLSAFTSDDGGEWAFGRIARPSRRR